ncbi:restriction endonuclease [Streptomyces sp. Ru87]|uniref:restriction endonuclease n=1 Tax=Streptomyces sp. Ru87 TaxID=2044307 RepID=UPI000BF3D664|nr:restriction endonuclease [Streptomyces sp. Ru87]PGH51502.1 restriction endonuclease [Streptomyces sp. Ru87]
MARRRIGLRRPRGRGEYLAAAVVGVAAATLLGQMALAALDELARAWPVWSAAAAAGACYGIAVTLHRLRARRSRRRALAALRLTLAHLDALTDQAFETALRDLLIRDGWSARHVGRQGDQAADVIGHHPQRGRIVLQAKHTRTGGKVGSSVMYQVKGTAGPVHRADTAVVVTNGSFTRDAKAWGERHGVHWIDRDRLRTWAEQGLPVHQLLRLPARPGRAAPVRRAAVRARTLSG